MSQRLIPKIPTMSAAAAALVISMAPVTALAGGLLLYEVGTAEVGLASAGFGARAQDASTVFTNPAGMTRLDGNQATAAGQLLWGNTKFSIDRDRTSPALGSGDGGYVVGSGGWFLGGGAFGTYTVSPDIKLGFGMTGNFGAPLSYDNDWVGRYYVQQTTLLGLSFLPSIAWKATDKLSLGASLNAMYGIYKNNLAINNIDPRFGDGRLELKNQTWGFGGNLGMLYEFDKATRASLTWNSQVDLDFSSPANFSNLAPGVSAALAKAGLLNNTVNIGIKVPQGVMGSVFTQVNDRWAVLGSVGWQQWSKFGQVQVGLEDTSNPQGGLTTAIPFKDTWHVAVGAQYRPSDPWLVNFGIAYDSAFQEGSTVSPLLPLNSGWRFGTGAQQQLTKDSNWGFAMEYIYGGTLNVNLNSRLPVVAGGRGDVVGSFNNIGSIFIATYYNFRF
ncbi:MAG: outer membrane protein transport protein [Betaproteobacteria bacterium]